jgi:hypothetical protein
MLPSGVRKKVVDGAALQPSRLLEEPLLFECRGEHSPDTSVHEATASHHFYVTWKASMHLQHSSH